MGFDEEEPFGAGHVLEEFFAGDGFVDVGEAFEVDAVACRIRHFTNGSALARHHDVDRESANGQTSSEYPNAEIKNR